MITESSAGSIFRGIGFSLAGFSLFSLHDALIKSISGVPVFQIVFFVVLFSFVPFVFMLAFSGKAISFRPNHPGLVSLRCLFGSGSLICAFYAFNALPLTQVYSLLFSAPVLITLLSIPILGEQVKEPLINSLTALSNRLFRNQGMFYRHSGTMAKEHNAESGTVCSTLWASV